MVFETIFNVNCHNRFGYTREMFYKACFMFYLPLKYCLFNKLENQTKQLMK